jgi:hypothetical protein
VSVAAQDRLHPISRQINAGPYQQVLRGPQQKWQNRLKRTACPMNGINAPQRPDCVAGHVGLEVRRETGKE